MPKHTVSKPMPAWPDAIKIRFDAAFAGVSRPHRLRLAQGLGRWLLAAERDGLPPEMVTRALVNQRTKDLTAAMAAAQRQALQAVFTHANVFEREEKVARESKRHALAREIARNRHRFPEAWQGALGTKLHFCPQGLEDGLLVEAWAVDTLQSVLQTAWAFFDFCRDQGVPVDVTPQSIRLRLDARQQAFRKGEISIATVRGEISHLKSLGSALFAQRDWTWLGPVLKKLKKQAALQPTRSDARIVDIAEVRQAANTCCTQALLHHTAAQGYKAKSSANKLARSGLALNLLVHSPIRRESLATLDLVENFDPGFTRLYLSAQETKDKKRDERVLTPQVQQHLRAYIAHHRAAVAPLKETALFVGSRGKPVAPGYLSQSIGDLCQKLFNKRVTPQVIRNIVAGFIVSQAPEKASLASVVLNHKRSSTTETYRANGKQVIAAQKLRAANDNGRVQHEIKATEDASNRKTPGQRRGRAVASRRH